MLPAKFPARGKVTDPLHRCERCPRYEPVKELVVCEHCYRMVCPQCVHRGPEGRAEPQCEVCFCQDAFRAVAY